MVGVAALVTFVVIAYGVTHGNALTGVDLRAFAGRQSMVTAEGQRVCVIVSLVGSPAAMTVLAVLGAMWLGWQRRLLLFVSWVTAFAGASMFVVVLKRTIHRARPGGAELFLNGASLSFPSGHAVGSVVGFGMLTYLLSLYWAERNMQRVCLAVIASGLVGAVAYSRLCLGVHYLHDVIAGLALGVAWLIICLLTTECAYRWRASNTA
ncbi:phosphatase PAP2 family protein [Gemmatimonas sp.]|uniref:phosphatase PAP2 family protein n=1 Tax=Gemmatimonas sp. TaxID=1962908 RepID=UPI00356827F6